MPMQRIMTGLSRFDHDDKREHGYFVMLSRRGERFQKRFSDGVYGGRRAALKAARAWLQEVVDKHPTYTRQQYAGIVRRNNTSGHPGVSALKHADGKIAGWAAHWLMPGSSQYQTRKFMASVHGLERAKELAIRAREQGLKELSDELWTGGDGRAGVAMSPERKARIAAAREQRASDWRVVRVRLAHASVTLILRCGACLQLPLDHFPALKNARGAARNQWEVKDYQVTWPALKLTIDAKAFLNPKLLRHA